MWTIPENIAMMQIPGTCKISGQGVGLVKAKMK